MGARWRTLGVGLALVAGMDTRVAAEVCAPAARVVGDGALVAPVEAALRERGVAVGRAAGTCAVHAELLPDEAQVRVRITDADGRTVEWLAHDPDAAATAIESWARRDIGDPLLAGHPPVRAAAGGDVHAGTSAGPRAPRGELGAAVVGGVSDDGGVWGGVALAGCARIGAWCLGAELRYAADAEVSGDTAALDNGRSAYDLALTVALPLERDRWTVSPHAGVGQSALTAHRDLADEPEREQASSPFLAAGVGLAVAFGATWSARLDVSLALAPFARPRLGENDGVDRQLAALPYARGWLGLGLTYEGL